MKVAVDVLDKEAAKIEQQTLMAKESKLMRAKTPTSLRPSKALAINHERISKLSQRKKSFDKSIASANKITQEFFNKFDNKEALLFVDVGLPKAGVCRLHINEGDNYKDIAAQFCKFHSLPDKMIFDLQAVLKSELDL